MLPRRGNPTPLPHRGGITEYPVGRESGKIERIRDFFRFRKIGFRSTDNPKYLNPSLAKGHYEVVPNDVMEHIEPNMRFGLKSIIIDESQEPSVKSSSRSNTFGIGGLVTEDYESANQFGHSLPDYIIPGDIPPNDGRLVQWHPSTHKKSLAIHEYKYSSLRRYCPDELQRVIVELPKQVSGDFVAKVVVKKPNTPEKISDFIYRQSDIGRILFPRFYNNPVFPTSHDMYAAVLEELLDDIVAMYPNAWFDLYLDPNTTMDLDRLNWVCQKYPNITPRAVPSDMEDGSLRVADFIIGASMEKTRSDPIDGMDTKLMTGHVRNRNAVLGKKSQ